MMQFLWVALGGAFGSLRHSKNPSAGIRQRRRLNAAL